MYYVHCSFCHNEIKEIRGKSVSILSDTMGNTVVINLDYDTNTTKYDGKNSNYCCEICAKELSLHNNKLLFNVEYTKGQIIKQYEKGGI